MEDDEEGEEDGEQNDDENGDGVKTENRPSFIFVDNKTNQLRRKISQLVHCQSNDDDRHSDTPSDDVIDDLEDDHLLFVEASAELEAQQKRQKDVEGQKHHPRGHRKLEIEQEDGCTFHIVITIMPR